MAAMSHPARVRGLKHVKAIPVNMKPKSHPARVRGLKLDVRLYIPRTKKSHPARVRGLKRQPAPDPDILPRRTPRGCVD